MHVGGTIHEYLGIHSLDVAATVFCTKSTHCLPLFFFLFEAKECAQVCYRTQDISEAQAAGAKNFNSIALPLAGNLHELAI